MVRNCKRIRLQQVVDETDGILSIAEGMRNIPFEIKRIFYIYGLSYPQAQRGFHAHKELEQALFCLNGSCKLLLNDGTNQQNFSLDDPNQGIYVGPKVWLQLFEFSNDCIILVFASDYFKESDYIRDYDEFIKFLEAAK
jgi:dTDP-4-dehydrorhamnose 3,5-epimerase-like enzyme